MIQTYKATLNGNLLEWNGEVPGVVQTNEPVSVIVTILEEDTSSTKESRPFGLCKDAFVVPKDFDSPLPADILADFEN